MPRARRLVLFLAKVLFCGVAALGGMAAAAWQPPTPDRRLPENSLTIGEVEVELATVQTPAEEPERVPEAATEPVDVVQEFHPAEQRAREAVGIDLQDGLVVHGSTPHRMILFTFDDGPDRRTTPRLLQHLDNLGVKAVFFVTTSRVSEPGARARSQADILRDIVRRGHFVGSHTLSHTQLPTVDSASVLREVVQAERDIEEITGQRPWLFRPPGGARSPRTDAILAQRGYTQMLWNLGSGDFQVRTPEDVVLTWKRVMERREREEGSRGGIVLLHDTHHWSIEAFPRMVSELRQRNCELLDQGEELYDIVDDPSLFFVRRQRGQTASTEAGPVVLPPEVLAERQARVRAETEARCRTLASR